MVTSSDCRRGSIFHRISKFAVKMVRNLEVRNFPSLIICGIPKFFDFLTCPQILKYHRSVLIQKHFGVGLTLLGVGDHHCFLSILFFQRVQLMSSKFSVAYLLKQRPTVTMSMWFSPNTLFASQAVCVAVVPLGTHIHE